MRHLAVLVFSFATLTQASAKGPDYCDDKIEPGESPDGKAMVMMSAIITHELAERYCGAEHTPLASIFVVIQEGHGCGPRSKLEAEAKAKEEKLAGAGLDDVGKYGGDLTKEMVQEFGGCERLMTLRRDFQHKYQNPPKWPREAPVDGK